MNNKRAKSTLALLAGIAALSIVAYAGWKSVTAESAPVFDGPPPKAVVYRSPACGCCGNFVAYLKRKGLEVEEKFMETPERSAKMGVPGQLGSCHTTEIGGYVVEGHIPVEAIAKLLKEKPDVKGIALPGMPAGSPGMPGSKDLPFSISSFAKDGSIKTFVEL